jgi:hypothetical protein
MDVGYIMEGENRAFEREQLAWLNECFNKWFADHPEVKLNGELSEFAMHAVARLVSAFVFNDSNGTDRPDFNTKLRTHVIEACGGSDAFNALRDDDLPDVGM